MTRVFLLLAGLAVLAPIGSGAQEQNATFRSSVNVVPIFATVMMSDGGFARGLKKEDFVITDNGKRQEIVSFSDEIQNISVSLVLDLSLSMANALPRVIDAAGAFLEHLLPDDRGTVGTLFGTAPPFTTNKGDLQFGLTGIEPDRASPIWSAIDRTMTSFATEKDRRVIVIYTDGQNNDPPETPSQKKDREKLHLPPPSLMTFDKVLARVEREELVFYTVGFEGVESSGFIKALARVSGGRAVDVKVDDDLVKIFADIADELHHQYLLGFSPKTLDGRVHNIDVQMVPKGFKVRARERYVAVPGGG